MTYPRAALVSPETTPYYHCISRCVRRAFLCGLDRLTGRSFEHRRQWVVERLALLSEVFTIDVCAYAVMPNHHHVVVRLNPGAAEALSERAVAARWARLFALPAPVARYCQGLSRDAADAAAAQAKLAELRGRLYDLSWFMRCLNESIARRANAEDGCTGRFWEGRFKSQALLDEAALLTCMSYVDLNPIRAGLTDTPEASAFTSIEARIGHYRRCAQTTAPGSADAGSPAHLLPFRGPEHRDAPEHLPFALADYLELVDWGGRAIRSDKRGAIPAELPPILVRTGIDPDQYRRLLRAERRGFQRAAGRVERLREAAGDLGQRFFKGLGLAEALFPAPG